MRNLLFLALIFGQPAPVAIPVDAHFADGSIVRLSLNHEPIAIQTKYGLLSVPIAEIRKIEFGLHIPAAEQARIKKSIRGLDSAIHKERELSLKELIGLGHFAFSAVQLAADSNNAEVAARAAIARQKIRDEVAPELLALPAFDVIHAEYQIYGEIVAKDIPVVSAYFGEKTVQISDLRSIHVKSASSKATFTVDAEKWGSSLEAWFDTNVTVDVKQRLALSSIGEVDLWPQAPGQYMAAPKGYNTAGKGGAFQAGALVGKIGKAGKAFYIGEKLDTAASGAGRLYLQIIPSPWNNASIGRYEVRIQTGAK